MLQQQRNINRFPSINFPEPGAGLNWKNQSDPLKLLEDSFPSFKGEYHPLGLSNEFRIHPFINCKQQMIQQQQ